MPESVGDNRRTCAAFVDGLVALFGGLAVAVRLLPDDGETGTSWVAVVACVAGVSFVHHVLGTLLFRGTVGKFLLFARVVRARDGGRPTVGRTVGRWAVGLTWLPLQPVFSVIGAEGELYGENSCGLRTVRSRDLPR